MCAKFQSNIPSGSEENFILLVWLIFYLRQTPWILDQAGGAGWCGG